MKSETTPSDYEDRDELIAWFDEQGWDVKRSGRAMLAALYFLVKP